MTKVSPQTAQLKLEMRERYIHTFGTHCVRCEVADVRVLRIADRIRSSAVTYKQAMANPASYVVMCNNCYWLRWWELALSGERQRCRQLSQNGRPPRPRRPDTTNTLLEVVGYEPRPLTAVCGDLVALLRVSVKTAYAQVAAAQRIGILSVSPANKGHNEKEVVLN